MPTHRRTAIVAGALYLLTFVTSIPAVALKAPALDAAFVLGDASSPLPVWGALSEILLAAACIGTAVALYPVVRRRNEGLALGFVAARTMEAALIAVGVLTILSIITLRDVSGLDDDALTSVHAALVAVHDWTFLVGPGIIPAISGLCLGSILYATGLVPRIIPAMGLIGAPLLLASATATIFGLSDQISWLAAAAALPIAAWEGSLGVWLVVKGFRPDALARLGLAGELPVEAPEPVAA
ncbi:DUF4386 domain-containing protein [Georgenia sp. Z1344]|uniref:DUF4386 domain-containing protein n=1 Tax=Georgenia sp. Z1344 TaxID=3416706 RepID=UPI003CE8D7C9